MPAFFSIPAGKLASTGQDAFLGSLTRGSAAEGYDVSPQQLEAWNHEYSVTVEAIFRLRTLLPGSLSWHLLFEYCIPGRRKRLDLAILTDRGIIAVEFKVGLARFNSGDKWQLLEYCWNLRDFHEASVGKLIAPVLVATGATASCVAEPLAAGATLQRRLLPIQCTGDSTFPDTLSAAYAQMAAEPLWTYDPVAWENSACAPTLDIIRAAQTLYNTHDVRQISNAYADNIETTTNELLAILEQVRREGLKAVCFVTGIPGAGKTLVGLNTAYSQGLGDQASGSASFTSGNNPLLRVLRAALAKNLRTAGKPQKLVAFEVSALLQNVHDFMAQHLRSPRPDGPPQRILIFDEAQRAWAASQVRKKNKTKKGFPASYLDHSEPEIIFHVMERCRDWCLIVALVGGGQEIYDGEAGLAEWGRALQASNSSWKVWAPTEALRGDHSLANQKLQIGEGTRKLEVIANPRLHLSVGKRTYRAQAFAEWVNHVLDSKAELAARVMKDITEYEVLLVRDLGTARKLLRMYCPVDQRPALLASSGALRLRSDGIELSSSFRGGYNYEDWFLADSDDIRSSHQLEVAATEFECQGLEVDWAAVCWGGDLLRHPSQAEWQHRRFRGTEWENVRQPSKKQFLLNKYRVLLTRAREGMVIWIPRGSSADRRNDPAGFEATAAYLVSCGLRERSHEDEATSLTGG